MPYAGVNGQRLYYEVGGEDEMCVLLHGTFADADIMEAPATGLATGLRALRIDRRSCGRSSPFDAPFSLADEAADIAALLDWFSTEKTSFLTHDDGAEVAIEFALQYPHRTRQLVFMAPTLEGYPWSPETVAQRADLVAGMRKDARNTVETKLLTQPIFEALKEREGLHDRITDIYRRCNGMAVKHERPARTGPVHAQRLGEIQSKTHVFIGEQEQTERILCARQLAMGIRGAEFVTFPGLGRFLQIEDSRQVMRKLTDIFMPEP